MCSLLVAEGAPNLLGEEIIAQESAQTARKKLLRNFTSRGTVMLNQDSDGN